MPAPTPSATRSTDPAVEPLLVACLCAAWCRVCDAYVPVFDALRAGRPGARFVWIDIEDEDELLGELEVETFPTLLIAQGGRLRFLGPVPPQPGPAERLIDTLGAADDGAGIAHGAGEALLARLLERA